MTICKTLLPTHQTTQVIEVPPGTYQLTAPLVISASNVTVRGMGPKAAAVELLADNNSRVFLVSGAGATIENVLITGGKLNNDKGGGVRVEAGASVDLIDVEIVDNFADEGGGLYNAGTTSITGSLLLGNDARRKGGGIENDGVLTVVNSTIADNEGKGGGGLSTAGTADLSFVTIFSNRSTNKIGAGALRNGGTLSIKNSLIANNLGSDNDRHDCSGTPNLDNVILTSDQGCNPEGTYDVVAPGQLVEPLPPLDNGGPTRTLALLGTSPAIDYTTACLGIEVDQRGVGRVDGTCDLGAYEVDNDPPTVTIVNPVDGATYQVDQVVLADYSCSDTAFADVLCEGPVEVGQAVDTATPGTKTFTVTATDIALNTATASVTYEVELPLALDVLLATDPDRVEVGAVTVPLNNITQALQAAAAAGTPISSTPLSAIPLSAITLKDAPLSAISTSDIPLSAIPLSAIPLSAIPLSAIPLSAIPLSAIGTILDSPLSAIPLSAILLSELTVFDGSSVEYLVRGSDLEGVPLQATHLGDLISLPLSAIDLSVSPLSAIPLSAISTSVQDTICGGPCTGDELGDNTLVAGQVGDVLAMNNLGFASTPLSAIPLSAILLGFTPLSAIPVTSVDGTLTGLEAWCDYLGAGVCAELGIVPPGNDGGQSLLSLSLQSAPLSAIPLSAIPLSAIGDFASTPLSAIPLSAISWASTPLSAIPLSAITTGSTPLSAICSPCAESDTLGEVAAADAFVTGVTLAVLEGYTGETEFSLADLIVGLVEPVDLAWEVFDDLNDLSLPDAADNTGTVRELLGFKQPSFDYEITVEVEGPAASVDVALTLPVGFEFATPDGTVPDPAVPRVRLDGVARSDLTPQEFADAGNTCLTSGDLVFLDLPLTAGTHTIEVPVWAGLVLGNYDVSVSVCGEAGSQSDAAGPAVASIEVIEEGTATETIVDGNLEIAHISTVGATQLYEFDLATNAQARIILSNLDADLDLTLFGPPLQDPLRGTPEIGYGLVEDFLYDLNPDDDALDPDALQDLPLDPPVGSVLHAVSANRGTTDEIINTGTLRPGTYHLQVSGYNGAISASPFALRASTTEVGFGACAAPPLRGSLSGGGTPAPPTGINTVFLYNGAWLTDAFGAGASSAISALAAVEDDLVGDWADLGVNAAAVAIDDYGTVQGALNNWDANRCDPLAANDVVRAIGSAVLDPIVAANPDLEYVVLVGDDSQVPFARMLDGTFVSNESQHGLTIGQDGELKRALGDGYYLSDDAYGSERGIAIADREFFVPELAVGRLVETPAEIQDALENFITYGGVLDARTAQGPVSVTADPKALVTAYDFLLDGGQDVVDGLLGSGFSVTPELSENWTAEILSGLLEGGDLAAVSINAHFDQSRLLPASENLAGTETDLFDIDDYDGVGGLEGVLVFSMGCHAGLSLSDVQITQGNEDWARTSAQRGNGWLGNTGYGYGDTIVSALSEKISANFASYLGGLTVGQALVAAKQQYAASLYTITPYDLKVSEEFTYYGLPMFSVGARPEVGPAGAATAASAGTEHPIFNDPYTGLESTNLTLGFSDLVGKTTAEWISRGEELLQVRGRALLPQSTVDVSSTGREAGGVLVTALTSTGPGAFDPIIFNPIAGLDYTGVGSGVRQQVGESTFPANVVGPVRRLLDPTGVERDRVVVVPARHLTDEATDQLEIFTNVELQTLYRPAGGDREAPFIAQSVGRYDGTSIVHFDVTIADGDVQRVLVLFRAENASGSWLPVDLVKVPGQPRWLGGRPNAVAGEDGPYEFIVQAVDSSANISTATGKGVNFDTITPNLNQGVTVTVSDPISSPSSGWYPGRVGNDVIATATSDETITSYILDGEETSGNGTSSIDIAIEGDGGHLLQVFAGSKQGLLFVAIDGTGPEVQAVAVPAEGWTAKTVTITAVDPFGSGVASIEFDDGSGWQPYAGPFVQAETATIQFRATDFVGNVSSVGTLVVLVDTSAPDVTATATVGVSPIASDTWTNDDVSVTITATDDESGVARVDYFGDLSGFETADPAIESLEAAVTVMGEGITSLDYNATDDIGNTSPDGSFVVKIDKTPPEVQINSPSGSYVIGEIIVADFECTDSGSGIASCVGTVANGDPIDTSSPGTGTFSVTSTDLAGNETTVTATYAVAYGVCLQYDPLKAQPATGAVPIKLQLCDSAGNNLSKANIELTADSIRVESNGGTLFPGPNDTGNANEDFLFRFRAQGYIYNLNTTEVTDEFGTLNPLGAGSFTLLFWASTTGPDVLYEAMFTLR